MATKSEPDLWLQPTEDEGALDCGCRITRGHDGTDDPALWQCDAHRSEQTKDAELVARFWRAKGGEVLASLHVPDAWNDPASWGKLLATAVTKLTEAYKHVHPDRSPVAIQRRIVGAFNEELRG